MNAKEAAQSAMRELKTWLKRDKKSMDLITIVEKFIVELRRERGPLKDTAERAEKAAREFRDELAAARMTIERQHVEAQRLDGVIAQLRKERDEALEAATAPPRQSLIEPSSDPEIRDTTVMMCKWIEDLRANFGRKCPIPDTVLIECRSFDITRFMKDFTRTEIHDLGVFVLLISMMMGTGVAFHIDEDWALRNIKKTTPAQKARIKKIVHWFRHAVRFEKFEHLRTSLQHMDAYEKDRDIIETAEIFNRSREGVIEKYFNDAIDTKQEVKKVIDLEKGEQT